MTTRPTSQSPFSLRIRVLPPPKSMSSHHHHHDGSCHRQHHNHNHRALIPVANYAMSSPCCCADSSPSPPNLDHLLRLIASYLQNQQRETQCSCEIPSPRFNTVKRQSFVDHQKQKKNVQREYDTLLRKIDEFELLLSHRRDSYSTLKDSAARVIQTHFRSYLVRRSITLRQLKEISTIKSSFLSLKSSVSGKTIFPYEAVSREATDLLLQLDSIQGRVDSMIRDGKRSLCRDLVRFLHYIDDCAVRRRRNVVCKSVKDRTTTEKLRKKMGTIYVDSNGGDEEENIAAELEEFHFMTDEIPIVSLVKGNKAKTPVTKTVKFGKNRNVYERTSSEEAGSFDDVLMISRDDGVGSNSRSRHGVVIKGNGGKTRVMKTVSFDEDGNGNRNGYKVYGETPEASLSGGDESSISGSSNENGNGGDEVEDIKYVPKENEGSEKDENEEEEVHSEDEEESSSEGSQDEPRVIENVSPTGRNEHKQEVQLRKGSSMFSPPLPLKMEL